MSEAVRFLYAFAQSVATMSLYREGHPARERAIDNTSDLLHRLLETNTKKLQFTFLHDEVVCGTEPIRELKDWDWAKKLAQAGMQRLEFDQHVSRDELEDFLEEVAARLTLAAVSSAELRQMRSSRIRFGAVGVQGEDELIDPTHEEEERPAFAYSLTEESDTLRWLHEQLLETQELHLAEAEAVVRSLSVAMRGEREMLIPLLRMRNFDEYTTTHALNVSVLAMAFTEHLGLAPRDVRTFGVAGLLHDIGKVRIPHEILMKPGKLTLDERLIINQHPSEGARILIETQNELEMAAVVAYEHHIMIDGGGYPSMRHRRNCHYASRIVHICDVYDALRTRRPYRDAWDATRVLEYIGEKAGTEFDGALGHSFIDMMRKWETHVARVTEDGQVLEPEYRRVTNGAA